ncbi:hypothetical protein PG991_007226 [Apiospora marii]|uniref:Secreted protein n=1 Tax=Apiospora marii TaxID=335849 RepID=A0ABR1RU06_9PEZI
MLVVLAGLMLGRQRQRRRHHNTNSTEQPAWDEQPGASAPDRASWMGRRILGKRRLRASAQPYYAAGHPVEGITAPEFVTGDHCPRPETK